MAIDRKKKQQIYRWIQLATVAAGLFLLLIGLRMGLVTGYAPYLLIPDKNILLPVHGPLIVGGFVAAAISIQRAATSGVRWILLVSLASIAGAVALLFPASKLAGEISLLFSAILLSLFMLYLFIQDPQRHNLLMTLGALSWFVSNLFFLFNMPLRNVVPFWMAFVLFAMSGERMELSRFRKDAAPGKWLFRISLLLMLPDALLHFFPGSPPSLLADRLFGLACFLFAAWLLYADEEIRYLDQMDLTRFTSMGVAAAYGWVAIVGLILMIYGCPERGYVYDAIVHSFFLGFFISIILAHAPSVIPSILKIRVRFTNWFYISLILMHFSVALRLLYDLAEVRDGQILAFYGNILSLSFFFIQLIASLRKKNNISI